MEVNKKPNRILIVDTLRGFALLLIVLIHYVEHFDLFELPEVNFFFSGEIDVITMEMVFLLISGKAYSIFALLFGLSFFIQMDRKEKIGVDFRLTFLWRLTILFFMGFLHSLIYRGDILHIYAFLGVSLLFLYNINTKTLLWISLLLVIQIPFIYQLIHSFIFTDYEVVKMIPQYWSEGESVYSTGSFYDVVYYNLWKGRISVWGWTIYNGRLIQLLTLFIIGLLLGRSRIFENISKYNWYLNRAGVISILLFVIFYFINQLVIGSDLNDVQKSIAGNLLISYSNLAITAIITVSIILVYIKFQSAYIFKLFAYYGKMSLSNYVFQAITGVFIFYGFGLALYKYLGSTWSLMLGFIVFFAQALISQYWTKKYYYGPLEWVWRAMTYRSLNIKFKRHKPNSN